MSALRKQTPLRWKATNERSPGGAIIATVWTAKLSKFELQVTNYPGTRTLDWEITLPGSDWRNSGSEDRFEYTVATLKDKVYGKATELSTTKTLCEVFTEELEREQGGAK